jgi:hypothetical protein
MASDTSSSILRLNLMATGNDAGTWGNNTNQNLQIVLEQAIAGYVTVPISTGTTTLTSNSSSTLDQSRAAMLQLTGGVSGAYLLAPAVSKMYIIWNNTSYAVNFGITTGGTVTTIPAGVTQLVWTDGSSGYTINAATATTATNLSGTTQYSVPYQSSSGTTSYSGVFSAPNQLFYINGAGVPTWTSAATAGSILYGGTSGIPTWLTAATSAGQFLYSTNGTSNAPGWLTAPTIGQLLYGGNATPSLPTWLSAPSPGNILVGSVSNTPIWANSSGVSVGTATTANALNASNAYTGTTFTASAQFSGPGTGLTGTASSLTVGTAATANALNTSNTYGVNGLVVYNGNGVGFYPSSNIGSINISAISASSLYVTGGLQANGLIKGSQLADSMFRVTSGSSANAGSFGTIFIDFAPSGTFTLTFPDNPLNGQKFSVGTYSNTITFAASPGAGTSYIGGVPSTITPTTPAQWTYYSGTSAWFRSG